jgi:membrane protease YdiL (CAAX protease family)
MFRGLYFPALGRSVGLIASGGISSLIFAAIHPTGVAVWLALGSIGAVSCALSCHTRSVVPSIIMHGLHNTTLLVASMLIS